MDTLVQVAAVVLSPIFALQISAWLGDRKEKRKRREELFRSLMLTRGDLGAYGRLSPEHVRALNAIDIEFYKDPEASEPILEKDDPDPVIKAWRVYRDHLYTLRQPNDLEAAARWDQERDKLLVELIYEIGKFLKYNLSRDTIQKSYSPDGHFTQQLEGMAYRNAIFALLNGDKSLHVTLGGPTAAVSRAMAQPWPGSNGAADQASPGVTHDANATIDD